MANLSFQHLNTDWDAEPNAPDVELAVEGNTVRLSFRLNPWAYSAEPGEIATLRFLGCSHFRWDATNDHAWFAGEGLYSGQAPKWGEFYEIIGDTRIVEDDDWDVLSADFPASRQFLFHFRDDTIEIVAQDWLLKRETPLAAEGHSD
jgi:hypothetical protein